MEEKGFFSGSFPLFVLILVLIIGAFAYFYNKDTTFRENVKNEWIEIKKYIFDDVEEDEKKPEDNTKEEEVTDKKEEEKGKKPLKKDNYLPSSNKEVVEHQYFTLSYHEEFEQAEWVAYFLTKERVQNNLVERTNNFRPDLKVSTKSAEPKDYWRSGFDRGHLCPAQDMSFDLTAMEETFFMSNMSPQKRAFNGGIWKELEANVRDWAYRNDKIYVITGPILSNIQKIIGTKNKVSVPHAYYKVILDYQAPSVKAIGFILPNELSNKPLETYAVSVNEVEKQTGIQFFPKFLTTKKDKLLKENFNMSDWKIDKERYKLRINQWNISMLKSPSNTE